MNRVLPGDDKGQPASHKGLALVGLVVAALLLALPVGGLLLVLVLFTGWLGTAAAVTGPCVDPLPGSVAAGPWRPPLMGPYNVSSRSFGWEFHPIEHRWKMHTGQDLTSSARQVVAASGGVVTKVGWYGGQGQRVEIQHAGGISTVYAHLEAYGPGIKVGAKVTLGQSVGREGSTGRSTGVHLHFEVHRAGTPIDPAGFMRTMNAPLDGRSIVTQPSGSPTTPAPSSSSPASSVPTGGEFPLPAPDPRVLQQHPLHSPPQPIPARIEQLYRSAAQRYRIPWTLLAGIGMEETAHGRNTATSSAGAQGHMQFMPSTWQTMGVDGDGDGRADIHNPADSIFSAANYLVRSGVHQGPEGVKRAIFAYNHADWYVAQVLSYAASYGSGSITVSDAAACNPPGAGQQGPLPPSTTGKGTDVAAAAQHWVGTPYSWGGGGIAGPSTGVRSAGRDGTAVVGFDCSSLVQYAVHHTTGITPPRTAEQQAWDTQGALVPRDWTKLQPGDVITFSKAGGARGTFTHVAIYLGDGRMIHAPEPGTSVTVAQLRGVAHYEAQTWRIHRYHRMP